MDLKSKFFIRDQEEQYIHERKSHQQDSLSEKQLSGETLELNYIKNKMDIIAIQRTFHPNTYKHMFSAACACGTLSKIGHILGHRASLNMRGKIEITSCILSDHHGIKLDINNRNHIKYTNSWKRSNTPQNEKWVKEKINKESQNS